MDARKRDVIQNREGAHVGEQQAFEFVPLNIGNHSVSLPACPLLDASANHVFQFACGTLFPSSEAVEVDQG